MPIKRRIKEYSPLVHRDIRFFSKYIDGYCTPLQGKQLAAVEKVLSTLSDDDAHQIVEIVGHYTGFYEILDKYIDRRLDTLYKTGIMSDEEYTYFILLLADVDRRIAVEMGYTEYNKELTKYGKESCEERIQQSSEIQSTDEEATG